MCGLMMMKQIKVDEYQVKGIVCSQQLGLLADSLHVYKWLEKTSQDYLD